MTDLDCDTIRKLVYNHVYSFMNYCMLYLLVFEKFLFRIGYRKPS